MSCPLDLCDGSGFVALIDFDGEGLNDEDNCAHVPAPVGGFWTPDAVAAFFWHYNTAHTFDDPACAWCSTPGWGRA